jgi:hypothetical protein
MTKKLYYTAPPVEQFEELRTAAISLWNEINDDGFSYATMKINRIKDIKNIEDNFMYIVAMFDINDQIELASRVSEPTRRSVRERMVDRGVPVQYITF